MLLKIINGLDVPPIGSIVYLRTDPKQLPRIIGRYNVFSAGVDSEGRHMHTVTFALSCGTEETYHYRFEFTDEPDALMRIEND